MTYMFILKCALKLVEEIIHNNVYSCVIELHVTVSYIIILSVTQQCFCGKFTSPATIKRLHVKLPLLH